MVKPASSKKWQKNNLHKAHEYTKKYMSQRKQMSVTVEHWVIDAIDQVKPDAMPYGAWVREFLEAWAKSRIT